MRRIWSYTLAVCISICFVFCNKPEIESQIEFPETRYLKGSTVATSDVYLRYPFRVRVSESSLYIMDIHAAEFYCHSFDYPSMQYNRSFAKRGEGPDEFLDSENIRLDSQGFLWTLDANKRKIVRFSKTPDADPDFEVTLSEDLIRTLDFDFLNDSTFIVPDYSGKYRINIIDLHGNIIERLFEIPSSVELWKDKSSPIELAQAWRPFLSYCIEKNILAVVTQLGQVLEIYDLDNRKVVNIVRQQGNEPQYSSANGYAVPTGIMGYSDVYIGRNLIYALFWGNSFSDIRQGKIGEEGGRKIHVFNLKGRPISELILDSPITGFIVDEKSKCIIGLDVNSNQPLKNFRYE